MYLKEEITNEFENLLHYSIVKNCILLVLYFVEDLKVFLQKAFVLLVRVLKKYQNKRIILEMEVTVSLKNASFFPLTRNHTSIDFGGTVSYSSLTV